MNDSDSLVWVSTSQGVCPRVSMSGIVPSQGDCPPMTLG